MSAGFDAAIGCPEGEMEVTPACYGHLTHMLKSLAGGKLVVVLEVCPFLNNSSWLIKDLIFNSFSFNSSIQFSPNPLYRSYREGTA